MFIIKRYLPTLLLATAAIAAFTVGCNEVNAPIQGRLDNGQPIQIYFASTDLRDRTAIGTPMTSRDEFNVLIVSVPIRNTTDRQFPIDYEVIWLDHNHQQIGGPTSAQTMNLDSNIQNQIILKGPPEAADFQINISDAK